MRRRAFRPVAIVAALALLTIGSAALAATGSDTTADTTPQGWKIKPAGRQIDTLRFPLGITPTADQSQMVVTSNNGGLQGLTVIDAATLVATPTPAANLFMGVSAAADGQIYASGGNANRVFRFRLAGPTAVNEDATEAATFPTHTALDGFIGRGPSPDATLPATDGIRVNGYPGNSVLNGGLLYVAGTLSEPGGTAPAETCPSGQTVCARVSVVNTATASVIGRAPVGMDAYGLALDPARKRLY
ncbi:MAG: hypothetical protein QOG64_449, partial [Acidimicrobiaceae bacterium]|nr:hypothetical protein [Acidimicrobiaceae bacterium]